MTNIYQILDAAGYDMLTQLYNDIPVEHCQGEVIDYRDLINTDLSDYVVDYTDSAVFLAQLVDGYRTRPWDYKIQLAN
jgi:hypothetical protein